METEVVESPRAENKAYAPALTRPAHQPGAMPPVPSTIPPFGPWSALARSAWRGRHFSGRLP